MIHRNIISPVEQVDFVACDLVQLLLDLCPLLHEHLLLLGQLSRVVRLHLLLLLLHLLDAVAQALVGFKPVVVDLILKGSSI